MEQVTALFNSDILIDYLQGKEEARRELSGYASPAISRITWMEILIGARDEKDSALRRSFLSEFNLVELNEEIADEAIRLRRRLRLKLPDAIIFASARTQNSILITRNKKDFPRREPGIRIPY